MSCGTIRVGTSTRNRLPLSARNRKLFFRSSNAVLCAYLAYLVWRGVNGRVGLDLAWQIGLLAGTALVAALCLFRPDPSRMRADPWAIAVVIASNWHYLLYDYSDGAPDALKVVAIGLFGAVGVWSSIALLYLGRSYAMLPAIREIKRRGPYALVRHPIYLGSMLLDIDIVLENPSWVNAAIASGGILIRVLRIRMEERLLRGDLDYEQYRGKTRWRLIPQVW
jgi:protein-S-isoprenylcysteine O-methyltransferase Ste14